MSLTEEAFKSALQIINHNREESYNIAQELGFSATKIKLFKILIDPKGELFSDSSISQTTKDYGCIKIDITQASLTEKYSDIELSENFDNIPDIFQIIYLLIRLNKQKNTSDLIDILERFKSRKSNLLKDLTSHLGNFRYFDEDILLDEEIERFKEIKEQKFENIYWQNEPYFKLSQAKILIAGLENNLNSFKELIDNYLMLAIFLLKKGVIN